jgi:transposase
VERTFAHMCETGGARRTWLRGIDKVRKRYLLAAAAHNFGCLMRELFGMGTPRGLQGLAGLLAALWRVLQQALIILLTRRRLLVATSNYHDSTSPSTHLYQP